MLARRNGMAKGGPNKNKNAHGQGTFMRRRKKIKLRPGHPSDAELIASYLSDNGKITKCPDGIAMGSMQCTGLGLE